LEIQKGITFPLAGGVIPSSRLRGCRFPPFRLPEKVRVTKSVLKSEQISCFEYELAVKKLKGPKETVSSVPVMEHPGFPSYHSGEPIA
jgi:hypothetical protein